MLLDAADRLQVDPSRCVMVGDIGSDMVAARAAGARAVLVPTGVTRSEEISAAPAVAGDLKAAVAMILAGQA
jgi:beta-phosphoglucomutase-like phosphatase (HAD superfamily)